MTTRLLTSTQLSSTNPANCFTISAISSTALDAPEISPPETCLQPPCIADQRGNRVDQIRRAQVAFLDYNRCAYSFERARVYVLMVIAARKAQKSPACLPP